LLGSVVIAFGTGNGPVGLADDLGSQPSKQWTYEDYESYYDEYDDGEYDDGQYEDYDFINDEQNAGGRKSYKYVGYKYVETSLADPGDADQKQEYSYKYAPTFGAGFILQYDERYAEAYAVSEEEPYEYEEYEAGYEVNTQQPDVEVVLDYPGGGYRGYSDAYPNQEDAYPEDLADAAESYQYKYEFSYPEAKYGNPEVLSNEIEQTEPENTSDPDDFKRFDEADEAASGEPGDAKSQWFGPYDDETSVLGAVRSWTAWSLDELAMAIHGVSEQISAQ